MFTQELLEAGGLKSQLLKREEHFRSIGKEDTSGVRNSRDVIGFLSKEQVNEFCNDSSKPDLLIKIGVTVISNEEVCFLVDDSCYGWKVLPSDFHGITFPARGGLPFWIIPREEFEDGQLKTAEDILTVFYPGIKHLNTMQELLDYLNR